MTGLSKVRGSMINFLRRRPRRIKRILSKSFAPLTRFDASLIRAILSKPRGSPLRLEKATENMRTATAKPVRKPGQEARQRRHRKREARRSQKGRAPARLLRSHRLGHMT